MVFLWIWMAINALALAVHGFLGSLGWWHDRKFKMKFKPRLLLTPLERFLF